MLTLSLSIQQKINNPIQINKDYNPIDYILIYQSNNVQINTTNKTLNYSVEKYFPKLFNNSFVFSQPFILCNDESNNYFLLLKEYYFKAFLMSEIDIRTSTLIETLSPNLIYYGYIKENKFISNHICLILKDEIILYGKSENNTFFYFTEAKKKYSINFGNIDGQISCKRIKSSYYICAFSVDKKVNINILVYKYSSANIKDLEIAKTKLINNFNYHENIILYDTSNSYYKILCAKRIDSNSIECIAIYVSISSSIFFSIKKINIKVYVYDILNDYQASFSYKEDNCNFTIFNNEYLLCCGKNDYIMCYRRNINFNLINNFSINIPGKISNLTFENNNEYIKLIYSNKKDSESNIYEYFIFPPSCKKNEILMIVYQTFKVNLSDLFERKTNTNYYISFNNIPTNFITLKVNDKIINNSNIMLIEEIENYLYIISNNEIELKNYSIDFNISIEETYSKICHISLTIEPCYSSCKKCSQSIYYSNSNEHNCIECKENYYPFNDKNSNCYTKEEFNEIHLYWYFDENKKVLGVCHSSCKQCYGPYDNNCLSCFSNIYLYKGKCLNQCPNGTFQSNDAELELICEDCYKNCETCSKIGNSSQMNCDSCSDNKIINNKECYIIHDEMDKSFYNPENELEITSCYEKFGKYIKENTSNCIDEIENGYFIFNQKTGLLTKFDSNCISYSIDKLHCESCKNNFYSQNGICVTTCSSNYYLYNNECYKCYDNCLNCNKSEIFGENGQLISMECSQCKDEEMIKNEKNCFPIIIYEPFKIIFNISSMNNEKKNGTCLYFNKSILYNSYECISKPVNTFYVLSNEQNTGVIKYCNSACDSCFGEGNSQDTNCIKCSPGYYKTEDSDTNCILENLIPSDYYKNLSDNIYYKKKYISKTQIIIESYSNYINKSSSINIMNFR